MRKIMLFLGVMALVFGATSATAQEATWSGGVKITSIETSNVNIPGAWLSFTTAPRTHTCSNNGQWMLGGGAANASQMASVASLALIHSRFVRVIWRGCSGGGSSGYPIIVGLTVL
jgi:hypothetical protein